MSLGPGDCLMVILEDLGIHPHNCECRERARQMNELGVEGCRKPENYNTVVRWLREEQAKLGWVKFLQAAANAIKTGRYKTVNPMDPSSGLVTEAIDTAEYLQQQEQATNSQTEQPK